MWILKVQKIYNLLLKIAFVKLNQYRAIVAHFCKFYIFHTHFYLFTSNLKMI